MDFLIQVFAWFLMIGIISILVIVHECGHFLVARFFGFQTPVFGIGLPIGPYVVVGNKWGTQFRIHACLLGGYVAIPELGDETQHDKEAYGDIEIKPFKKFPIWQRALVAVAGVSFNVLFAYLIMLFMLMSQGKPIKYVSVDGLPKDNPIAAKAGVKEKDLLKGIDGKPIKTAEDAIAYLTAHASVPVTLNLVRASQPVDVQVTPNAKGKVGMGLGLKVDHYESLAGKNIIEILGIGIEELWTLTDSMMKALGMMFGGLWTNLTSFGQPAPTGTPSIGIGDMHGILAVLKIGADIAQSQDWSQLFIFTILISMDLAIINLVPWPALDGGHLAFMFIEALRGKPMGERAQGEIVKWGMLSLLGLMAIIMVNDVMALVTGKLEMKKKDAQVEEKKPGEATTAPAAGTATPGSATPGATPESAAPGAAGTEAPASPAGTEAPGAPTAPAPGAPATTGTTTPEAPVSGTPTTTPASGAAPGAPATAPASGTATPPTGATSEPPKSAVPTTPAQAQEKTPESALSDHLTTKTAPAK